MKAEEIAPMSLTAAQQALSNLWDEYVEASLPSKMR